MVDAKDDKYEGQDEGEYHFSDDQFNYDMEQESPKPSTTAAPVASSDFKQNLVGKLGQHRRLLIGGLVSLVLFFIIYKMLTPATTTQTEFSPVTTQAKAAAKAPMQETQAAPAQQPTPQPQAPAPQMPSQAMQPQPQQASPVPVLNPESMNTATPQPMNMPSQNPTMMPPSAAPGQGVQQQPSMPQQQTMAQQQSTMPTQVPDMGNPQTKNVMDRLAVVEEQNAKIMNLMQTQFAQKIAEYESQTVSSQEKIHVLTKRMANMEVTLNKMAQLMQDQGANLNRTPAVSGNPGLPPAKVIEPKMVYSVQAIIPGRAWLKSDSGDTVTVAEGDMLKDYGRVTKIDPYDGIVDIDTGSKIITLSYGSGNE